MLVSVEVQNDHLEKLATAKRPILAIAELVWNALDADAKSVTVDLQRNGLNGIDLIRVRDDGHGIAHNEALIVFKKLGGSWKRQEHRSKGERRILHGKDGQGRYKAFALGDSVNWVTRYKAGGQIWGFTIAGNRARLKDFEIADPARSDNEETTGTMVEVRDISRNFTSLDDAQAVADELAMRFALYLREYPHARITFNGVAVSTAGVEEHFAELTLPDVTFEDGTTYPVKLAIIEWKVPVDRALYYCDADGFALERRAPGIQEPGFTFTAYVKSPAVPVLDEKAAFAFEEGHPDVDRLYAVARTGMKGHFLARRAELAKSLIEEWKAEDIYPYEGEPTSPIERSERQVFDVVAKNVYDYLPDFDKAETKSRKFSLHLLKEALESSPHAVQHILREVLELPADKAEDLANLLKTTTLTAIIAASRVVADRLDFLRGLEMLLYNPMSKEQLLERAQLQKIIEEQTWIFGEEFSLTVADQSLKEVLRKHLDLLGREPGADKEGQVTLPDGGKGIVDLMLSRLLHNNHPDEREHLIVELKRPSQKITPKVLGQVKGYALAVAKDERFRDTKTIWHFWAVSNDMDDSARDEVTQSNRPTGLLMEKDTPRMHVWAMPWSRIIEGCRARLRFYQEKLEYAATDESALAHLRRVHEKYLPSVFEGTSCGQPSHNPPAHVPE